MYVYMYDCMYACMYGFLGLSDSSGWLVRETVVDPRNCNAITCAEHIEALEVATERQSCC